MPKGLLVLPILRRGAGSLTGGSFPPSVLPKIPSLVYEYTIISMFAMYYYCCIIIIIIII